MNGFVKKWIKNEEKSLSLQIKKIKGKIPMYENREEKSNKKKIPECYKLVEKKSWKPIRIMEAKNR